MYKIELHVWDICFVQKIFFSCLMTHVLEISCLCLGRGKHWEKIMSSIRPSFYRNFIMEEGLLCYITIFEPNTKKSFMFYITQVSWKIHLGDCYSPASADLHSQHHMQASINSTQICGIEHFLSCTKYFSAALRYRNHKGSYYSS